MTRLYALLRLFPDRDNTDSAPQHLLGLCMCVLWLLLLLLQQHRNNSQKSNIEWRPLQEEGLVFLVEFIP